MKMMNMNQVVKQIAVGLAACAALLAGSAQAATLTWNPSAGGNWNTSTANWTADGGATTTTFPSDNTADVIFNKTAGGTIVVSAGMQPASTTVSAASGTYIFSGEAIAGAGGLTKSGGGTLTIGNMNSYTGKTIVQGGTVATALGADYLSNAGVPGVFGAPTGPAATIDLHNGVVLQNNGSEPRLNQATDRPLNLAGTGSGTVTIRFNDNDTSLTFGAVTATGTGAKLLDLYTGYNGNGDREAMIFTGAIADSSDGSPTSLRVNFRTQTGSTSWVSLSGVNTFTGPITLVQGSGPPTGYLVIGGVRAPASGANTVGTGTLGNGNYPGAIALATGTILEYDSTAAQTLSGVISGPGALQVTGSGALTLSGVNTYTGTTTVNSGGKLTLASTTGGLKFVVTDAATNNKVTGAGTATMNGIFTIDTSAVTVNSGSWTLVNTTTKSFGASFSVNGFNDADLDNIWTKLDGTRNWTFNEATGVLTAGTVALFTSFGLPDNPAIIDNTAKTIQLFVPVGTNLATLAPVFTVSSGTCNQTSGAPPSPTFAVQNPATYTITDGAAVNTYSVSVQTYETWAHSGSLFILTTPDGANIPAGDPATNFPLLIRLNAGNFNFGEAQPDGADIRFITAAGSNLSYQIEQWDAVNGQAAVWVKIPTIAPNARQEIKMYWGKSGVASQSNGANVFNAANGYASVLHMNETVTDVLGTVTTTDTGTTLATGMIGKGRNFTAGKGINCGTNITNFPQGNSAHSTQAWFRTSAVNCDMVDWGVEGGGYNKVQIRVISPPRIYIDGNFASVTGNIALTPAQWHQVVHTYTPGSPGVTRIYVDGQPDTSANVTMTLPPTSMMWIGGWYNNYYYVGDIDEVRVSKVARSANWIKLEYENQNPLQSLVGSLVQDGSTFSVSPTSVTMAEGTSTTLTGQAGGAQKVYWIQRINGVETLLATDQFTLSVSAGRSTGTQSFDILFRAVYPTETTDIVIPVTVTEAIPDPVFTLTGPSTWDGRQTITITPDISNLAALQAAGVANLTYSWSVAGVAVTKTITAGTPSELGTLTLTRSQGSGPMTVTLVLDNGGALVSSSKTITVQEPATDAWVQRTPEATEKAVNNQFYARDPNTNMGTIFYNGTESGTPDTVFLKIYTTDTGSDVLYASYSQALVGGAYAFTAPIAAGKVTYKAVYGTTTGGVDTPVGSPVTNLVCGDAYIIDGQSNALATDNTAPNDSTTDPWIRTYGLTLHWGSAISKGSEMQLGLWGWYLAKSMTATYNMPVCFIQGAVGGTRIDQHQANPADHAVAGSLYSIYANIYKRVVGAKLTHGIRGVFWHQGENNSGAAAPTGDYDYKSYQQYFVDMSAAWKQDFPNLQRYIIYQVMPKPCAMGPKGDQLREVQRTLPRLFSKMNILCTLGMEGYEGCHFNPTGYQKFADLTAPLVGQDFYGVVPPAPVTAPNLQRAYFTTTAMNEIALEFDQDMSWNNFSKPNYYIDKVGGKVTSGSVSGKVVTLQLSSAGTTSSTLDYLEDDHWSYNEAISSLLSGANGIAALTFADVAVGTASPYADWAANPAQGLTSGVNDGPMQDPDHDGIVNLLEFTLAGAPMVSSSSILPKPAQDGANWLFEYDRSVASRPPANTQVVEYGSDLTGWTAVTVPLASSGIVEIIAGATTDHVKVTLPDLGAKVFARLKVSQ